MKGASTELQEISLVSFLNDSYILAKCKDTVTESFFSDNSYKLIYKALKRYYDKYSSVPTERELKVLVEELYVEDYGSLEEILDSLDKLYSITISSEDFVYEKVRDFLRRAGIERSLGKLVSGMERNESVNLDEIAVELMNSININFSKSPIHNLSDITSIKSIKEEVMGDSDSPLVIKLCVDVVNKFMQYRGLIPGTLNLVCAPPGRGKTTFLINQGVSTAQQGFKVLHVFLGDMSKYDGLIRYLSCLSGIASDKLVNLSTEKLADVVTKYNMTGCLSNITIASYAADELNVNQLIEEITAIQKENKCHYHMIIIDYDENLRMESESMYDSGGRIYNRIALFAVLNKSVVFIASQPKPSFWDTELIPLEGAAESSKKQKIIDLMLTIGKPKKNSKVGSLFIAKNRRGEDSRYVRLRFDTNCARIVGIDEDEYRVLKDTTLNSEE